VASAGTMSRSRSPAWSLSAAASTGSVSPMPNAFPHHVDDRQVRDRGGVGEAAPREERRALAAETVPKLAEQPRLPHARLAENPDHLSVPSSARSRRSCSIATSRSRPTNRLSGLPPTSKPLRSGPIRLMSPWPSGPSPRPSSKRCSRWGGARGGQGDRACGHSGDQRIEHVLRVPAVACIDLDDLPARRDEASRDVDGPAAVHGALARIAPERGARDQRRVRRASRARPPPRPAPKAAIRPSGERSSMRPPNACTVASICWSSGAGRTARCPEAGGARWS
jgi:hypothetical protein